MATGSLMMGTLKGKLGETVAMRRNGKQVVRAYISNPKNPNSQKQQVQRMVQATAAQAYSAMKLICDHSFEGVQVGQKSMSYFLSKNMDYLRSSIVASADGTLQSASADFVRKGVNTPVLNQYIVARGSLPEVSLIDSNQSSFTAFDPSDKIILFESGDVSVNEAENIFLQSINGAVGDWLTFVFLFRVNGSSVEDQPVFRFGFVRFVVEQAVVSDISYLVLSPSLSNVGIPSADWSEAFLVFEDTVNDDFYLTLNASQIFQNLGSTNDLLSICAYSVIHSRQNVGGTWQRSNAQFHIRNNWASLNIDYPGDFFDEIATYAGAGEAKGTGDYVLNGGD